MVEVGRVLTVCRRLDPWLCDGSRAYADEFGSTTSALTAHDNIYDGLLVGSSMAGIAWSYGGANVRRGAYYRRLTNHLP